MLDDTVGLPYLVGQLQAYNRPSQPSIPSAAIRGMVHHDWVNTAVRDGKIQRKSKLNFSHEDLQEDGAGDPLLRGIDLSILGMHGDNLR